jgi:hypothetical protein
MSGVVREPAALRDELRAAVEAVAGGAERCARFERLGGESGVADATEKWLVRSARGERVAVVLRSSPAAPGLIARGVERSRAARARLGDDLARPILEPLGTGAVDGCSWAAYVYRRPFSDAWLAWRLQRAWLRPRVLGWLRGVARVTASPEVDVAGAFEAPLVHMAEHAELDAPVRAAARAALERLASGAWRPKHVLAHNDLWKATLLRGAKGVEKADPFVVIDWPGSWERGHPLYDLVRIADSIACKGARLRAEVEQHCRILGCEPVDARAYLLAALGAHGLHLEHFPVDAWRRTVGRCVALLDGARVAP